MRCWAPGRTFGPVVGSVFDTMTKQAQKRTATSGCCLTVALALLLFSTSAGAAATWYVDSSVGSSGNGQAWATAWKNISNITGVSAGDTVYISGGPTGSSRTYAISSWTPASGNSTARITYQIGQDAAHNGTAYFSGSGNWLNGAISYVNISGDAGDGQMHFSIADPGNNTSPWSMVISTSSAFHHVRISYVNFGRIRGSGEVIRLDGRSATMTHVELDHFYMYGNSSGLDIAIHAFSWTGNSADQWDQGLFIHDATMLVPSASSGTGADCIQDNIYGLTVSNCVISGISGAGGVNHQDGIQHMGHGYTKIVNNTITGMMDIGIYLGILDSTYGPALVANNIVAHCGVAGIELENEVGGASDVSYRDILFANNTVEYSSAGYTTPVSMKPSSGATASYANVICANNAMVSYGAQLAPGVVSINNVTLSAAQCSSSFVSWVSQALNNDYRLKSTASQLIGHGTNISSVFAWDKDGNARAQSGAWDVGAYRYATPNNNPVIGVSPASVNFGSVPEGSSKDLSFTVENMGGGTLVGTASVEGAFSIVSGGIYSLGAGESQVIVVRYSPTVAGSNSEVVTFAGGDGMSATVSGSARSLVAITVTPSDPLILTGGSLQFTAVGTYSDGSFQDITDLVTWGSSLTTVATINSGGLAAGVASGIATMSAGLAGRSGTTVLTVQTGPLTISTTSLIKATLNVPYTATLAASGGTGPYSWSITGGSLPSGLTLNTSNGLIAGTPRTNGAFSITIEVSDAATPPNSISKALDIVVSSVVTIWPSSTTPTVADENSTEWEPCRVRRKVSLRCGRKDHRHSHLQSRCQYRYARGQPLDQHRNVARLGHFRQRDCLGVAGGVVRYTCDDQFEHCLCSFLSHD